MDQFYSELRRSGPRLTGLVAIIAGTLLMACAADAANHAAAAAPLIGEWGGPQIQLTLTATGGRIDSGCGAATLDAPVRPDAKGNFSVTGHHQAYAPGPQRADEPVANAPARYEGHLDGTTLHLAVHPGDGQPVQRHTLERGRRAKLIRCM